MNLLKKFKEWRFSQWAKTVGSPKSTLEGRTTAMLSLFEEAEDKGNDRAWLALMKRWDISVDHTLHDEREKDEVRDRLISLGERAVELVKQHCAAEKSVGKWASDVLFKFLDEASAVAFMASQLEFNDVYISKLQSEKDLEILQMFRTHRGSAAVDAAIQFLKSPDESHRYAAIEVVEFQADPKAREALEAMVSGEESGRVRKRAQEALAKLGWGAAV